MNVFTSQLRVGYELRLGADDAPERWSVRVQVSDAWDVVLFSAPPTEPVLSLKVRAIETLGRGRRTTTTT
jgi:hypothetical protein